MTAPDANPRKLPPPKTQPPATGFLEVPPVTEEGERLFAQDVSEYGFVLNATRMWARQPDTYFGLFEVMQRNIDEHGLDLRQRAILIVACTSTLGDAYCSLGWGAKLADMLGADTAAEILRGGDAGLTPAERAMARWARKITADPNYTSSRDVQELHEAGYSDDQIFGITVFVALRLALATINDALGARPDSALRSMCPVPVLDAVTYGRPIDESSRS